MSGSGESKPGHLVRILGVTRLVHVEGPTDRRVAAIAGMQRGRVARRQLLAAGLSRGAITTRRDRGLLHPIHRGVFAVGHTATIELGRETAALLACGEDAILSHLSAAALWRVISPPRAAEPIDVTLAGRRSTWNRDGIRAHASPTIARRDIVIHRGLPVTSPARMLLEIAPMVTMRELERAFDESMALKLVSRTKIEELLARSNGHRGVGALAHLVAKRRPSALTRSQAEERMLELIRAASLPEPEVNVQLHGFQADFLWRSARVAVEIDGYDWHWSRSAFDRDRRKDAVFRDRGVELWRLTPWQLDDQPLAVVGRLARLIALGDARTFGDARTLSLPAEAPRAAPR